MLVFPL
ncbi:hypothetical protein YPPY103_3400, partial [Yersinia pestis PY-103]